MLTNKCLFMCILVYLPTTDPNSKEGPLNVNIEFEIQMFSNAGRLRSGMLES